MRTHRKCGTKIYVLWKSIKQRCYCPSASPYKFYGGRGITMYEKWIHSFETFYEFVSKLPNFDESRLGAHGLSLDRIDNERGYFPDNIRWVTMSIQSRNIRLSKRNTTGYIGVSINKKCPIRPYKAAINLKGYAALGQFKTAKEAAIARDKCIIDNNLEGFNLQVLKR